MSFLSDPNAIKIKSIYVNGFLDCSGVITNNAVQPAASDSSTKIPTTAWVKSAITRESVNVNFDIPANSLTNTTQSMNYPTTTIIQKSGILAKLSGVANTEQQYTFGKSIPNRWVACGFGGNSLAYSSDGINWTGLGTGIFSQGLNATWNGTRWVAVGDAGN